MTALLNRKAIDMSWVEKLNVICGVCDKGGVGKTSFISSLGTALASAGYKVLIIDANAQGNISQDLGIPMLTDAQGALVRVDDIPVYGDGGAALTRSIVNGTPLEPIEVPGRENLFLCMGGPEFTRVKRMLASVGENEAPTVLAVSLKPIAGQYHFVLIDSPPEDKELMKVVMAASRWVVCPTKSDSSSILGLTAVAGMYTFIREEYNPYLQLLGSFIFGTSMVDDGKPFKERLAKQQEIMGEQGIACPHGIPFVERVGISIRDYGMPPTELERMAIDDGWPAQEISSIIRVARAWIKVISYFRYELDCRIAGHRPGAVDHVELIVDEKSGSLTGIEPVYATHLTAGTDEAVSA